MPALVIERFDRTEPGGAETPPQRIHQEDFNQVLGTQGDQKYQRYGGKVSLARVARELTVLGDVDGVRRLARMTVLAAAVGNLDMHAKNLALLHHRDGTVRLAPAYDVVPQAHLPNDGELALSVDRTDRHASVTRSHLVAEIDSWGVREARRIVEEALDTVLATVSTQAPDRHAHPGLSEDILRFTTNLREGRAVGARQP